MKRIAGLLAIASLALWSGAVGAQSSAYDQSWYRSEGWGGEYPNGFTLAQDVTVDIRKEPAPKAAADISCQMRKGATYHPWNQARTTADQLQFLTFTKIEPYRVNKTFTAEISDQAGQSRTLNLPAGTTWDYLANLAEGSFLFRYQGETYVGGQDMFEQSASTAPDTDIDPDEWLGLRCANGTTGWLLLRDVADRPGFDDPNIMDYGQASDATAK